MKLTIEGREKIKFAVEETRESADRIVQHQSINVLGVLEKS